VAYLNAIPETDKAAQLAAAATFGGKNDWFLPSCGELNLLHMQRNLSGIGITPGFLWSSSQNSNTYAWDQDFSDGTWENAGKDIERPVRAIRAF